MIDVRRKSSGEPLLFEVMIIEGASQSSHIVTMRRSDSERLLPEGRAPEDCITAAFRFLLDREPKESILPRFDVMVITRYFPEFERELPRYLDES